MLSRSRCAWHIATAGVLLGCFSGCPQLLLTPIVLFRGTDIPAPCDKLEEHKVAIVCRTGDELLYSDPELTADLSMRIGHLLREHGRKIKVISHDEVANWIDEQQDNWSDFKKVGEGVGADLVVAIDLGRFSLYRGQTLYQGRADVRMTVYDLTDEGEVIYQPDVPKIVFPPNAPVESSVKSKSAFRRQFIGVIAENLARHYYAHDPTANFASDSTVLRR